jgi:tetratricopeptide (TPR) repeat protein
MVGWEGMPQRSRIAAGWPGRGATLSLCAALLSFPAPVPAAPSAPLPPEVRALVDAASRKLGADDTDGALKAAEEAARLAPHSSEVQLWLGRAWGQKALEASIFGKPGAAKKCRVAFELAVALDPSNVDARSHLVEFYLQAPGFMGGGDEKAIEQADEIAKLAPVRGHIARASIAGHRKDTAGVERELKAAAAAERPGTWIGRIALSSFLLEHERPEEARSVWQQAIEIAPQDMMARYQLARLASITGKHLEEAVGLFQAYLATTPGPELPTWADANWRLGQVYERLGRKEDAAAAWRESLRLDPTHARAKAELERVTKG